MQHKSIGSRLKEERERLNTIGSRLQAERERLGYGKKEFAERLQITPNSLYRYETDEQIPGGKILSAVANLGLDVAYILAGTNRLNTSITPTEIELVDAFRRSPRDVQTSVLSLLKATAI